MTISDGPTADARPPRGGRPTIRDLAAELGVSIASVSFALNGKPGVSEALRARILDAARDRGWAPNLAARALSGRGIGAVGLVLTRRVAGLAEDTFYLPFLAGLQSRLSRVDMAITFQLTESLEEECAIYRRWAAQARVDGLVVVDGRVDDPRIALLEQLNMPVVIVGAAGQQTALGILWSEDEEPMARLLEWLTGLGHRRIAHLSGPEDLLHTGRRVLAYEQAMSRHGLSPFGAVFTDYRSEDGEQWLFGTGSSPGRATAVICDNDSLAVGVLRAARQIGISVPGELSIVSWEDSPVCLATTPPLTSLHRDPVAFGAQVADALLSELSVPGPVHTGIPLPELIIRGSTGPPPGAGSSSA